MASFYYGPVEFHPLTYINVKLGLLLEGMR
jgi:hypothetical protein